MAIADAPPTGLIDRVKVARRLPTPAAARAIRMGAGVTQQELANELAVDRVTVARWEAGDRTPRGQLRMNYVELLEQLAALLFGLGASNEVESRSADRDSTKTRMGVRNDRE